MTRSDLPALILAVRARLYGRRASHRETKPLDRLHRLLVAWQIKRECQGERV